MIYELVTPSDPITFLAKDDKVAIATAIMVGDGQAGCHDEKGNSLRTMFLFHPDPLPVIKEDLGCELDDFIKENHAEVVTSLHSFAYGNIEDRQVYDDAVAAITEPEKLMEFKKKHEDRNRSSMSKWVQHAWALGDALQKQFAKPELLTLDKLKAMAPDTVFAEGEIENSEEGLFMTNSNIGRMLYWVAIRGGIEDWCIVTHWKDSGREYVVNYGDKVTDDVNIRKLVPCDDEAFKMYRK